METQCSVETCETPARKRGWCASHYHQARVSGTDPVPFKFKWSNYGPCLNCGVDDPENLQLAHLVCNMRKSDRVSMSPAPSAPRRDEVIAS